MKPSKWIIQEGADGQGMWVLGFAKSMMEDVMAMGNLLKALDDE